MLDEVSKADDGDIRATMVALGQRARTAAGHLANTASTRKDEALRAMARALRETVNEILRENALDVAAMSKSGAADSFVDRLILSRDRVEAMATGIEAIAALADPVGVVMDQWERPNGLHIERVRTPLGVIGVIYESRPNVTADAGALCLKSGNAAILRGGSDSFHSTAIIHACLVRGLEAAGLSPDCIQVVPTRDRAAVGEMLSGLGGALDVIVPRGGHSLVERVHKEARVPVFAHLEGICHVYIHHAADADMARDIVVNSKMRRTGICGAAETVLIDRAIVHSLSRPLARALQAAGCTIRADEEIRSLTGVEAAEEADWSTEYLGPIISMAAVDGVDGAAEHIARYGSSHTESIVTQDQSAADRFLEIVDSAIVMHNASTQFADGGEFGMGAEIGIATGRMHARGPVGVEQLTSFKYRVRGNGQIRP
jgi:glutamate-5-semialdehyde dehydrogenase